LSLSGKAPVVESNVLFLAWLIFYLVATVLRLERYGVEINPLYAMYKSTALNDLLARVGRWKPGLWRVVGNVGVASFFGQVAFMSYLLFKNLYRFIYVPREASPVMPLIPGVTISFQSLPWFLAAAGVVILLHELAHGVMCVVEGVEVKSAAVLLAVVTFGGAVEPDEEAMERAGLMSKLRIFASGSLVNLATGLLLVVVFGEHAAGVPAGRGADNEDLPGDEARVGEVPGEGDDVRLPRPHGVEPGAEPDQVRADTALGARLRMHNAFIGGLRCFSCSGG